MARKKPVVLLILDGWGHRSETANNAISSARTPTFDKLFARYPHTLISGSGEDVGLPDGQMGNSEVGHLSLGSGRIIYQDLGRIHHAIETGEFDENPVLKKTLSKINANDKTLHVLGLLSPGGVHSHEEQIFALLNMAKQQQVKHIHVHAFLDGRDTPPKSAKASLKKLEDLASTIPGCRIATISGRYYAMDRDKRWDRVKLAYDAIVYGQAPYQAGSAVAALDAAYDRGETDEFVKPTIIIPAGLKSPKMSTGDEIIYMNFRADRARALSYAFTQADFTGFDRNDYPPIGGLVTLTKYDKDLKADVVFPAQHHVNVLGEYLQNLNMTQLHIAETEKYAHVTFFFNGGVEAPFKGEERILVPSPKVATYDLQPEMSALIVTDLLVENILQHHFDFIICNFANADMVGHTGNFEATVKAIETLDSCVEKILNALEQVDGELLITADHGNAECMVDPITQQPHTAHTTSLVPFVYVGSQSVKFTTKEGKLSDVAPTILTLMGLPIPTEMTGHTLLQKE